jgi:hypothetical protein
MVSFLHYTLGLILPFILVISCEGLTLPLLTSQGVYKDIYLHFNSFNSMGVFLAIN